MYTIKYSSHILTLVSARVCVRTKFDLDLESFNFKFKEKSLVENNIRVTSLENDPP